LARKLFGKQTYSNFRTERDGEQHSVVTKASETDDTDFGALTNVVPEQGTCGSDTGTQPV
jgi:hypothetical protein